MYIVAVASSIINTTSVISDFDDLMEFYSVIVTCEIRPTSTAQYCEVFAQSGDATLTGKFTIGMYVCAHVSMDVVIF